MTKAHRILLSLILVCLHSAAMNGQQVASQSNQVPNNSITIDGDVTDWAGVPAYGIDPPDDGVGGYDISAFFMAHDDTNYYVRIQLYSDEVNFGGTAAGLWTPFDTDKDSSTGLQVFASSIGAEWNGSGVSQFNGWSAAGAWTGSILGPDGVPAARDEAQLEYEYAIPRSVFDSNSSYVAVQSEFGDGDLFPDEPGSYFEYHAAPVVVPPKPYRYETDPELANPPAAGGVLGDVLGTKLTDGIASDPNWLTGGQFVGSQDPFFVPADLAGDSELPQPRVEFTFESPQPLQSVEITYLVDDEAKIYAPDAVSVSFSTAGSAFGGDIADFGFDDSDDLASEPVGIGAIRTLNVALGGVLADRVRLDFFNDFEWTAIGEIKFNTGLSGDLNANGILDSDDVDAISRAVATGSTDVKYDFDQNDTVNHGDVLYWINDLAKTWIGDANVDGLFNSADFVAVFQAGKFEQNEDAVWSQGDWSGDNRFTSQDFVTAFQQGGYEMGPRAATAAVPEPQAVALLLIGLAGWMSMSRRRR